MRHEDAWQRGELIPVVGFTVTCQRCRGGSGTYCPAQRAVSSIATMLEGIYEEFVKDERGRWWHRRCVLADGGEIVKGIHQSYDVAVFPHKPALETHTGAIVTRREVCNA